MGPKRIDVLSETPKYSLIANSLGGEIKTIKILEIGRTVMWEKTRTHLDILCGLAQNFIKNLQNRTVP